MCYLCQAEESGSGGLKLVQNTLKISNSVPNIKYKIKGGRMFFNRKTIFESVGLEAVIGKQSRLCESISGKDQVFGHIWIQGSMRRTKGNF